MNTPTDTTKSKLRPFAVEVRFYGTVFINAKDEKEAYEYCDNGLSLSDLDIDHECRELKPDEVEAVKRHASHIVDAEN